METLLTLNNTRIREFIFFLFLLKVRSRSTSTLGCYIIKTAESRASNDAPYERYSVVHL